MIGLVVLFTQPARRAKANRADGQQGQQPFHRERVARLGDSGVLYGRGLGSSRSRSRGRGGRGRSDRRRNNGGHAVPLGVPDAPCNFALLQMYGLPRGRPMFALRPLAVITNARVDRRGRRPRRPVQFRVIANVWFAARANNVRPCT